MGVPGKRHGHLQARLETKDNTPRHHELSLQFPINQLLYHGANFFRLRIILATAFNKSLRISDIRSEESNPGLTQYEASLLRLVDKITDGGYFHIDVTGTELEYRPGMIIGGDDLYHDCGLERNISYFLEALLLLAPFAKNPLNIRLKGLTHGTGSNVGSIDPSVDLFRTVLLPFMHRIGLSEGLSLKVLKRGVPPFGQGEVEFKCPVIRRVTPLQFVEEGRVKRVRGTCFTNNVSPQFSIRMIDRARGVLNNFLPDVWIYSSSSRTGIDGPGPGYGITLIAETMKGCLKGAEIIVDEEMTVTLKRLMKNPDSIPSDLLLHPKTKIEDVLKKQLITSNDANQTLPSTDEENPIATFTETELVGRLAAQRLLLEIHYGGVIDTTFQHIPLLFMAMAEEHQISKIKLCRLTPYAVQFLRHLKDFCGVIFTFEEPETFIPQKNGEDPNESDSSMNEDTSSESEKEEEEKENNILKDVPQVILKCVGIGFTNVGKKTF